VFASIDVYRIDRSIDRSIESRDRSTDVSHRSIDRESRVETDRSIPYIYRHPREKGKGARPAATDDDDDDDDDEAGTMSMRRRPGGARKMKAFSRVETIATAAAFDRAMKKRDQLLLVEFVSVREVESSGARGDDRLMTTEDARGWNRRMRCDARARACVRA